MIRTIAFAIAVTAGVNTCAPDAASAFGPSPETAPTPAALLPAPKSGVEPTRVALAANSGGSHEARRESRHAASVVSQQSHAQANQIIDRKTAGAGGSPAQLAVPIPEPRPARVVTVESIYDGDTVRIRSGASSIPIRVMGLDAPELRQIGNGRPVPLCETAMADQARAYAQQLLTAPGATVTIEAAGADKYGRLLAWVFVDGAPFNDLMIQAGHGRKWAGRREEWC